MPPASSALVRRAPRLLPAILLALLAPACGSSGGGTALDVGYDAARGRVLVEVNRPLKDGERLHARLRNGAIGEFDCARDVAALPRVDGEPVDGGPATFAGPAVDDAVFEPVYDDRWLEGEPTAEMIAAAIASQAVIDVCLVSDAGVVREGEFDVRRALDQDGAAGKADGEEELIASTEAYAEKCVEELGEIPFFQPLADGDYTTYDCLDATPIATTVTDADGVVAHPDEEVDQCDNPQYIYSLCEPNAVDGETNGPRVTSAANPEGTEWVLLCRKSRAQEGQYNDIAMIGHNPYTGKTCYFQNALSVRTDGVHVPHPGDKVESPASPQQSTSLWQGIHGGLGSGIQCARCHDADPFIHTPWIDQAVDERGDPVVPKMGIDEDFGLGYADAPYSIVNTQGQGWTMPKVLTSPEAAACTRCHRIGDGRWTDDWIDRLVGEDSAWKNLTSPAMRTFAHTFWMPPDLEGLSEATWATSEFGRAVDFIQACGANPSGCTWAELPTDPLGEDGELPTIDLTGEELARAAGAVLGADVDDASCPGGNCATRRCAECHSLSVGALRRWHEYTELAWSDCDLDRDPESMTQAQARASIKCMRLDPSDASSPFAAARLGILATGVQYGQFRKLFQKAEGDGWLMPYLQFKARVGMPKGNHPKLSQREFAIVSKWFADGLPAIDDVIETPPAPTVCEPAFDQAAMTTHLETMRFDGWAAVNKEEGLRMFGCPGDDPLACLTTMQDRTATWGNGPATGKVRQLRALDFTTSYWTRSSPDGRFVGNGGGNVAGSTISDLTTGVDIPVDASYDPGFFPDNSGFMYQGTGVGAGLCPLSVLEGFDHVTFEEPGCSSAPSVSLYQHVARGLGGGDYFAINSQWSGDFGGSSSDPGAFFDANSTIKLTPMIFDGTQYVERPDTVVDSPYEGDSVLSPSARMVASRLASAEGKGLGYVIRKVNAVRVGNTYDVDIGQKLATICMPGAKPAFSYDERFLVTHHYHDGRADILLVDLTTGQQRQITKMPSGFEARYPHFRNDGWLYFLVDGPSGEFIAASDAAVRWAAE